MKMFPSPCGDMVLKFGRRRFIMFIIMFPSPCGDMVLKFKKVTMNLDIFFTVSVPLRGYGFEMMFSQNEWEVFIMVSVPLRGYGFEIV